MTSKFFRDLGVALAAAALSIFVAWLFTFGMFHLMDFVINLTGSVLIGAFAPLTLFVFVIVFILMRAND